MQECQIIRGPSTDQGTFGKLWLPDFEYYSLELPWKDNQHDISCIPAGEYEVVPYHSSHLGQIYRIKDVPGRTNIRIHAGNWAGDMSKGYRTDSKGCIFLGLGRSQLSGQEAVVYSRAALNKLIEIMAHKPFRLKIVWQEEI